MGLRWPRRAPRRDKRRLPLSLGDPTADDIWALAKECANGISRTEVLDLFSRNKKAREIDRALTTLVEAGRLQRHRGHDGNGRPAEIWTPLRQTA